MNEQLNYFVYKLQIMPLASKLVFISVMCVLIILYYAYIPADSIIKRKEEYKAKKQELVQKGQVLESILKMKTTFPEFQQKINTLTEELQQKVRRLPDESEIPSLLKSISKEAYNAGLKITSFVPQQETPDNLFYKLPIKIDAEGSYHQIVLFFDRIARLPRIVSVSNVKLSIARQDIDRNLLRVSTDVIAYRFKDKLPQPVVSPTQALPLPTSVSEVKK